MKGVGGQTSTATFDPAKNPGWTDNMMGQFLYGPTSTQLQVGLRPLWCNVVLRLSFPNAKYKNGNKQIVHKQQCRINHDPYQQGTIGTCYCLE